MVMAMLALVLHAHLPYVRHPEQERFLEEQWYYQALTECYLPLARVLRGLVRDGVDYCLTISFSPTLLAMFEDPLLQRRCRQYLERLMGLAAKERRRLGGDPSFAGLAAWYEQRLQENWAALDECGDNPLVAFYPALEAGRLELITTAATHGYLPLMYTDAARKAQIAVGVREYARHFGGPPPGFWLPECGYPPGVDQILVDQGVRYFFAETHGLLHARPWPKDGVYAPVCCPSGAAVFGRDPESSRQVWDRKVGYPGHPDYREYYRDIGYELDWNYLKPHMPCPLARSDTGFKYYRITGSGREKQPYDRSAALARAAVDAHHFLECRNRQAEHLARKMDRPPLIVAPYDAELFGHWWCEGPEWLNALIRLIDQQNGPVSLTTPGRYLKAHPPAQTVELSLSSWGAGGYSEVWLNPSNDWLYPRLHRAEEQMAMLTDLHPKATGWRRRVLTQAARELLLAQSSDWAFILKMGTAAEYARRRFQEHLDRFKQLVESLDRDSPPEEQWLAGIEAQNRLFPELDYRLFSHHRSSAAVPSEANGPRVLMLSSEFPPRTVGGLGRHVYEISRALVGLGLEVLVVTAPAESGRALRERVDGVDVLRLSPGVVDEADDLLTWVGKVNRGMVNEVMAQTGGYDLVHAHDWLVGTAGMEISRRWGCPLVATMHATEHGRQQGLHNALQRHIHQRERLLVHRAEKVICCSQFMADEVDGLFGVPRSKVCVIPNGVDAADMPANGADRDGRGPSILFIGRLVPEKGVQVLIEALSYLVARHPEACLTVAGRGPWEAVLREQTHRLDLDAHVAFAGFVDGEEKKRLLAAASVAVFPSLYEPFGIVALEAMASGVPVVVSDTGGLADIVAHGVDGFKVSPGRSDLLAYYLNEVLRFPALGRQMASRARRKVLTMYNWEHIAQQTIEVYTAVAAGGGKSGGTSVGGW